MSGWYDDRDVLFDPRCDPRLLQVALRTWTPRDGQLDQLAKLRAHRTADEILGDQRTWFAERAKSQTANRLAARICDDPHVLAEVPFGVAAVAIELAKNPAAPPALLRAVFDRHATSARVTVELAKNPACPADVIAAIATAGRDSISVIAALRSPACPPDTLAARVTTGSAEMRRSAAMNPACPLDAMLDVPCSAPGGAAVLYAALTRTGVEDTQLEVALRLAETATDLSVGDVIGAARRV